MGSVAWPGDPGHPRRPQRSHLPATGDGHRPGRGSRSWAAGRPWWSARCPASDGGPCRSEDGETMRVAADAALGFRIPMVLVLASSGADVSEGVASLHGWGQAARALARCSGVVPLLVVVTGPAISGPALHPRPRRSGGDDQRRLRLRLGPGHGRGVHRGPDRDPPAGRHGHARPLQRAVRHRGRLRGGRTGPRRPPVGPAARPPGRAGPDGGRPTIRPTGRSGSCGRSSRPGPPAPTTCAGWRRPWPTTTT